jgi:hypothetical protein
MLTTTELNTFMPSIFTSKQLEKVGWDNLSTTDKEALITQAEAYIDSLRYKGKYLVEGQEHQFPRIINDITIEVNERVKKALTCIVYDLIESSISSRYDLQKQGVKSISTGGVSETYKENTELVSDNFKVHIGKYLFRGVL